MSSGMLILRSKLAVLLGSALMAAVSAGSAQAAALNIADTPLFLTSSAEPLVMLALSNDEQLYHKAYTDFDDVDGDGLLDTSYKDTIDYSGYFDSRKCYAYTGTAAAGNFFPTASAAGTNSHDCDSASGGGRWSGNFLNWVAMTRMDALRKVFYGGYRSTDTSSLTMLERAYLPNDNHAWTKFYGAADLNKYTPYDIGTYSSGITMCNVTPRGGSTDRSETNTTTPRFRIAKGQWPNWAAQESKQCLWRSEFTPIDTGASPDDGGTDKIDEFTVRVKVCDSGLLGSEQCKTYGSSLKPTGLLQDFADADKVAIRFGLMTGSYGKRKSGGVLRKNVSRLTDEIDASNGTFTNADGIIKSINLMRISRYAYSQPGYHGSASADNCPFGQNTWANGSCANWGNPMGEMYLEALRYFGGKSSDFSSDDATWIAGLKEAAWDNPYTSADLPGGRAPYCAKPSVIAISTGVLSFDHDEYGGAADITGLNVNTETDAVGTGEGIDGNRWYVGSLTGGSPNDVCTSQTVNDLSTVTGICPESAGLQGSFKIAGLASFAHKSTVALQTIGTKDIQPVDTYTVALAPPIPSIKVAVGTSTVTIIPVGYQWRDRNAMSLVNFRVISQSADGKQGVFFMNYENAPAGSDYDNDMKGYLSYVVTGNEIKIIMHELGSSAGATQNMGYIIDGVTDAGTHYLISNRNLLSNTQQGGGTFSTTTQAAIDTSCAAAGFASDPATVANELCHFTIAGADRYMRGIKTHAVGAAATNSLKSPLWYAAKWGGFKDANDDDIPQTSEWDADGDGVPDTYFPVTDAGTLGPQLSRAFNEIIDRVSSASSASVNSGSISNESRIYQARFSSRDWTGELLAFEVNPNTGALSTTPEWNAADPAKMPAHGARSIFTLNSAGSGIAFNWTAISADATRKAQLDADDTTAQRILNYLRGDDTYEQSQSGGMFRNRTSKLGDIVSSSPLFVGAPPFRYRDTLESAAYSTFRDAKAGRTKAVYVGANDGMLHAFNAENSTDEGKEMFAYIPGPVFKNLKLLTNPSYTHRYYVDGSPNMGDAFYGSNWHTVLVGGLNKGGQGIYALDITDPSSFSASKVLWEFNDVNGTKGDADLGYTFSRPAIVRLNTGKWAAIFGNGYNNTDADGNESTTGQAALYIVDIEDGTLIRKISTGAGSVASPNGLATPAAVDFDGDADVDYVYAGDLLGNLWKFDLTDDTDPDNWNIPFTAASKPAPLYIAADSSGNRQPITSRPEVGRGPNGNGMVVLFGTGKFLEDPTDKLLPPAVARRDQSFYGIYDPNSGTSSDAFSGRIALGQQTIDAEPTATFVDTKNTAATTDDVQTTHTVRVTSNSAPGTRGWYMDLVSPAPTGYQGERVVSNPLLRNNRVVFTTVIPDSDPCGFGGNSWLMELDALTGKRLTESPFDLNRDGQFTDADFAIIAGTAVPASGMQSTVGITPEPGILTDSINSIEYKYTPGTSGNIQMIGENPGVGNVGRQSWRQIR